MKILSVYCGLMIVFLFAPILVVTIASFTSGEYVSFPPEGFSWRWYREFWNSQEFAESALTSFQVAAGTSLVSSFLGSMVAVALSRFEFPGRRSIDAFFALPIGIPSVVLALALLLMYSVMGFAGTKAGLVAGHSVLTTPLVIRLVRANFAGYNPNLERAASGLGASPLAVFWNVTLPLLRPGIIGGAAFAFVISFDEVVVSLFLAGPSAITLPVRIYTYIDQSPGPIVLAAGSVLVGFAVLLFLLLESTVKVARAFGIEDR